MDYDNDAAKPHPSEFVEFASLPSAMKPTNSLESQDTFSCADVPDFYLSKTLALESQLLTEDVRTATEAERKMSFWHGCKLYPKAIAWSLLLSCTIIMEGYDTTLITSFYAFPMFRKTYGVPINDTMDSGENYQISSVWQSSLGNGAIVGQIIGLIFNGLFVDKFGYHRTLVGSLIWMCIFVFLFFFAVNIEMLLAAQILCGISWGTFQTLSTTYAAEIMPINLRGYLLSNVNMCWLLGQLCGSGIIRAFIHNPSEWAYRIPFALQWAWAVPLIVGILFAPESPWWLVRHGRLDSARQALLRLTRKRGDDFNVDNTVQMMKRTDDTEKHLDNGEMTYRACFKGANRRRTEIACMVWATQALCGSSLTNYAAYFYEQAGFPTMNSFNLTVGMYGLAILGGFLSWTLLTRVGRRKLYLVGLSGSFILLVIAGLIDIVVKYPAGTWALGSFLIALTFIYDITVGPVCYVLVAEIPSTRLRVKTVVIARIAYNLANITNSILTPKMLNPTAWDWRGKSCFFYAGTTALCLIWCWFRLPETKGLSYLELDILFEKKADARKFRQVQSHLERTGYFDITGGERRGLAWGGY